MAIEIDVVLKDTENGFDQFIVGQQRSSTIHRFLYSPVKQRLIIEFASKGQPCYTYFDVPSEIIEQLIVAESLGKFFSANLRNQFKYQKGVVIE
jgi:hypothetical protein